MRNLSILFCIFMMSALISSCAATGASGIKTVTDNKKATDAKVPDARDESAAGYGQTQDDQYIYPVEFASLSLPPQKDEPELLRELLELKTKADQKEKKSFLAFLRPNAIRDAAHLVSLQTAVSYRYDQLLTDTRKYAHVLDTAFNFAPLMMTQGETLIMPPVLTRSGQSLRIEDSHTATTSKTTYELLFPAKYISVVPDWHQYLMSQSFPEPEQPNPALLPRTNEERLIWRAAVRQGWAFGMEQAEEIYKTNISRMARDFRGITLYHLLTAQNLLSRAKTAKADMGIHINNNKMYIGQKVYRITSPSRFIKKPEIAHEK